MEEYQKEPEKRVSKYNAAMDQMYRLGEIWRQAYKHASNGEYSAWNIDLDTVWRELAGDLKEDDSKVAIVDKINADLVKTYPLNASAKNGFRQPTPQDRIRIAKQYALLQDKEIFLRRLQNELGKGTAYLEEDEDDFG